MREIKFRAWDRIDNKLITDCVRLETSAGRTYVSVGCVYYSPDDLLIMQYTGLKDKNGKEIYEGDIVDQGYCQKIAIIEWNDGMFFSRRINATDAEFLRESVKCDEESMTFLVQCRTDDTTVIGNIHENPELLK